MAQLCIGSSKSSSMKCLLNSSSISGSSSIYGSSPPNYEEYLDFGSYLAHDNIELFEHEYFLPSIRSDVEKMESDDNLSISGYFDDLYTKPEIRNSDCMWSAGASCTNTGNGASGSAVPIATPNSNSAASSYSESSAVPPAIISGNTMLIKRDPDGNDVAIVTATALPASTTIVVPANERTGTVMEERQLGAELLQLDSIKVEQLLNSSSANSSNSEQFIPPGASLLRKSNNTTSNSSSNNNNNNRQSSSAKQYQHTVNARTTKNTVKSTDASSSSSSSSFVRPDTSNSQQNDAAPSFRHNVDLRACVMGSNNISLTNATDAKYIEHLKRELQNTSKQRIDLPYDNRAGTETHLSDVMDVLNHISKNYNSGSDAAIRLTSDCDSDDGDCSLVNSSCGSDTSLLDGNNSIFMHHRDHSYTRCNEMVDDGPTLETPSTSDSDEEIDVVSLNDKKLPTNPSDKDRRALQTKVAHKMRIVQTKKGVRCVLPRRRGSYELPYTPASSSPVKSVANSRYPSPSSTPYQSSYSPPSSQSSDGSNGTSSNSSAQHESKSRKRYYMPINGYSNGAAQTLSSSSSSSNNSKKYRAKKSSMGNGVTMPTTPVTSSMLSVASVKLAAAAAVSPALSSSSCSSSSSGSNSNSNSNSMLKRQYSLDEADTIEKRNLHNDMERQRRVGLKNLFEALKKQIPSIRDKERAPKVNILREAAKLCEGLTLEELDLCAQLKAARDRLKMRQEHYARLRQMKAE